MALLTLQDGDQGLAPSFVAAAGGGDTIPAGVRSGGWDLPVVLVVKNLDATTTNVTVAGLPAVTVPATNGVAVIPVAAGSFNQQIAVTYSKVTSLTVAAVRLASGFVG